MTVFLRVLQRKRTSGMWVYRELYFEELALKVMAAVAGPKSA